MSKRIEGKKFKSIIQRVVRFPFLVFAVVMLSTLILSLFSFYTMQGRMIDSNLNLLQISMNQLDNQIVNIDKAYIEYWNSNKSYKNLKQYPKGTKREEYLADWVDEKEWQKALTVSYGSIQGVCSYFPNIDCLNFIDNTRKFAAHPYIRQWVKSGSGPFNCWQVVKIAGECYLINLKKYGNYYGAVWIAYSELEEMFSLASDDFIGEVYLIDSENKNSMMDNEIEKILLENVNKQKILTTSKGTYYNFLVTSSNEDVSMGLLIPASKLYTQLPWTIWFLICVTLIAVLSLPVYIFWVQKKIAVPFTKIDQAVQRIGEGDMDYRMALEDKKSYDEFDRLVLSFNEMMDRLNELEFNLYKTKVKQQRTELKYISQQIRPHFILNALNIIYTYDKSEFPLIKEMILYLTQYFRYIVNLRVDFVEVEKEFHHVENYLKIQKMRYDERFDYLVQWSVHVKEFLIPPLVVQTFVENCIKYGMRNDGVSFIRVHAGIENEKLKLTISDTGNGFSDEKLQQIQKFIETREYTDQLGVGIQNTIERMDMLYEGEVEVKIRNVPSGGALIEIWLPTRGE